MVFCLNSLIQLRYWWHQFIFLTSFLFLIKYMDAWAQLVHKFTITVVTVSFGIKIFQLSFERSENVSDNRVCQVLMKFIKNSLNLGTQNNCYAIPI